MVWPAGTGLHRFRYAIQPMSGPLPAMSVEMLLVLCAQGSGVLARRPVPRVWRFASVPDLVNIMKAALFGLLAIVIALFFKPAGHGAADRAGAVSGGASAHCYWHAAAAVSQLEGPTRNMMATPRSGS